MPDRPIPLQYATRSPRSPIDRLVVWISLIIGIGLTVFAWLTLIRGHEIFRDTGRLWQDWLAVGAGLCGIAGLLITTPPNAIRISPRRSIAIILVGSAAMQIAAIALLWPALSSDWARYYSEGGVWLSGQSPYAESPQRFSPYSPDWGHWRLHLHVIDQVVDQPERASIYPPIAQLTFVVARYSEILLPRQWWFGSGPPITSFRQIVGRAALDSSLLTFRVLYSLSALVSIVVLIMILRHLNAGVWWAVLFAWNPVVIMETGAMVHVDIVGVLFLLLTILMLQKNRSLLAGVMLALACGVKPQVAILLPWLLRDIANNNPSNSRRHIARSLGGFAIASAIIYIPALAYQDGYLGFASALYEHATLDEFNGSIYELINRISNEAQSAKIVARAVAIGVPCVTALMLWRWRATFVEAGYWLFLVTLLVSPVVYPWHQLWMLCFAPLLLGRCGLTGMIWCATVGISYQVWHEPQWRLSARDTLIEYAPVYFALVSEVYRRITKGSMRAATSASGAPIFQ